MSGLSGDEAGPFSISTFLRSRSLESVWAFKYGSCLVGQASGESAQSQHNVRQQPS